MTVPASQKPAFALWLIAQRKSRPGSGKKGEMTTAEMRAAIKLARGFSMGHSTYAQLESGSRKPTAEQYGHITGYLGVEPPPEPEPETQQKAAMPEGMAALVDGLREQSRQIGALVDAIGSLTRALTDARAVSHEDAQTMTANVIGMMQLLPGGEAIRERLESYVPPLDPENESAPPARGRAR